MVELPVNPSHDRRAPPEFRTVKVDSALDITHFLPQIASDLAKLHTSSGEHALLIIADLILITLFNEKELAVNGKILFVGAF